MRLNYRGTNYEYDIPTVDTVEGPVVGSYRGQSWHVQYARHIPRPSYHQLQYRGVAYNVGEPAETNSVVSIFRPNNSSEREVKTDASDPTSKVHYLHLCQRLEYRKQVAKAKGDEKLLLLLEAEGQQMVC